MNRPSYFVMPAILKRASRGAAGSGFPLKDCGNDDQNA